MIPLLIHLDIRDQFARLEWEQRKRLLQATAVMSEDGPSKWTFPPAEITLGRDRFENVQPFEYNRVKMQVPEGENDYINASMIKLGRFNYIAAQAPMESTVTHFWNMIDRYHRKDINLRIVMLTNFHEFNEQKCYTYFPEDLGTIADYESRPTDTDYQRLYRIETASVTDEARTANYTQRTLKVKKTGLIKQLEIRRDHNFREFEVEHAHFHGWQDSSVPQGIAKDGLIAMIRALFDYPEQATLVVHDSAGVGRTGVYIALDMLLCGLDNGTWSSETSGEEADEEEDPIFAVVNNLRKQRINMVQNEAQYAFLYEVLRVEWIRKFGKKAKSPTIAATDWSS
ncbi:phosphatases II [Amniculicola lignicola CBS 123094]|uniref:Phosphatases II n=1 Tax=Amniculicola lignicola CBS 123094 TaxID=1392246 RepID=A0A6A5X3X9_9PLEO|nr:phosphatases II [Amniculicola lignicola CBS 123094]